MHDTALDQLTQALELETPRFATNPPPGGAGIVETR